MILAGDIGGTSTRLALFDAVGERVAPLTIAVFSNPSLDRLEDAVDDFLRSTRGQVHAAAKCAAIGARAAEAYASASVG
jgi:glucokinase